MTPQEEKKITNENAVAIAAAAAQAAIVGNDIKYIQRDIQEIKTIITQQADNFVTTQEFDPIKRIVYGMVALMLTSVMVGLLALVVQKQV